MNAHTKSDIVYLKHYGLFCFLRHLRLVRKVSVSDCFGNGPQPFGQLGIKFGKKKTNSSAAPVSEKPELHEEENKKGNLCVCVVRLPVTYGVFM